MKTNIFLNFHSFSLFIFVLTMAKKKYFIFQEFDLWKMYIIRIGRVMI